MHVVPRVGERLNRMHWLDQNAGADGWAMTPRGIRGVINDAVAVHFADVTIASAFVTRWYQAQRASNGMRDMIPAFSTGAFCPDTDSGEFYEQRNKVVGVAIIAVGIFVLQASGRRFRRRRLGLCGDGKARQQHCHPSQG
jgi:hypothetical protein